MNKLLIGILIICLALVGFVSAIGQVDITTTSLSASGNPGDTVTFNLGVKNSGEGTIPTVNFVSTALEWTSNAVIKINAPTIGSLSNIDSSIKNISFTIAIPSTYAGVYNGKITASEAGNDVNKDELSYSLTVNSKTNLDVLEVSNTTPLIINGQEDSSRTGTFKIKNIGSVELTNIQVTFSGNMSDDEKHTISLVFSEIGTIKPNEEKSITVTANIPENMELGTYKGIVTISKETMSDSFELQVVVQPEVCKDGPIGKLKASIENPDTGDNFKVGESIDIKVNVKNNHNKDLDVVVEAFLYNLNDADEIERVTSDSQTIDNGKDVDFELSLDVPVNDESMDEGDTYILYVESYEDGNEDTHCAEDSIKLDLERNTHDVVIQSVDVTPSALSCGDIASFNVKVLNIGTANEEDVYVELKDPTLKVSEKSGYVDLKKYSSKDNDAIFRFSYNVPRGTEEKAYQFESVVWFNDGKKSSSKFATLTVSKCGKIIPFNLIKTSFDAQVGSTFGVPFTVENDKTGSVVYNLDVSSEFADSLTKEFNVAAGSKVSDSVYLNVRDDVKPGTYTATITLKADGNIIDTKTLSVKVSSKTVTTTTPTTGKVVFGKEGVFGGLFEGKGATAFFIIGDVVLILIAIFLLTLIFRRPRREAI